MDSLDFFQHFFNLKYKFFLISIHIAQPIHIAQYVSFCGPADVPSTTLNVGHKHFEHVILLFVVSWVLSSTGILFSHQVYDVTITITFNYWLAMNYTTCILSCEPERHSINSIELIDRLLLSTGPLSVYGPVYLLNFHHQIGWTLSCILLTDRPQHGCCLGLYLSFEFWWQY